MFTNHIAVLGEVSVEMRPSALATLGKVVAVEQELRGELLYLLSVLQLEAGFHDLSESDSVAGTTGFLVSDGPCVVVASNRSPVEVVWDL